MLSGNLSDLTRHAPRVQVNGRVSLAEAEVLARLVGTLITQHNDINMPLLEVRARNHALLMDSSGGRGLSPEDWLPPVTGKDVGFAGGMGPSNLVPELHRVAGVARPGAWVDMEGKLRVDDWFDISSARQCAQMFCDFVTPGAARCVTPARRLRA